ncbi:MAG: DUF839 domain-containing protein [Planctomycetota bacterium]|nr:DUF839 domain-containing protein [Planctomycetota bacterium]
MSNRPPTRRDVLRSALAASGLIAAGPFLAGCGGNGGPRDVETVVLPGIGGLEPPDANGLRLPPGFSSRIVATSGQQPVQDGGYAWHRDPDGGAVFPQTDGGWIYVSNSERDDGAGGVGALRFDAQGSVVDAYPLLQGTTDNCAGGATPWGTWLSCEEYAQGHVFECDPTGQTAPQERLALGTFAHEAAAVDPATLRIYLTEDEPDGRLYRFTPAGTLPSGAADLSAGVLEVAGVAGTDVRATRSVSWYPLAQPNPDIGLPAIPTRYQAALSTAFEGGEGIFHHDGRIYFTTKRDNRVWVHDIAAETVALVYDGSGDEPIISQVDNVTLDTGGNVFVAEDGPRQRIVAFTSDDRAGAILEVVGHEGSELTGPAFDPSGTRLYFSSQRGPDPSGRPWGVTFEVTGPFATL